MSRRTIGRPKDLIRLGLLGPISQGPPKTTTVIDKREYLAQRLKKRKSLIRRRQNVSSRPVVPEPFRRPTPEPNYELSPEPEPQYEPLILEAACPSSDEYGDEADQVPMYDADDGHLEVCQKQICDF